MQTSIKNHLATAVLKELWMTSLSLPLDQLEEKITITMLINC